MDPDPDADPAFFVNDHQDTKKTNFKKVFLQDPDPDPLVRGIDPRIRIYTKMS